MNLIDPDIVLANEVGNRGECIYCGSLLGNEHATVCPLRTDVWHGKRMQRMKPYELASAVDKLPAHDFLRWRDDKRVQKLLLYAFLSGVALNTQYEAWVREKYAGPLLLPATRSPETNAPEPAPREAVAPLEPRMRWIEWQPVSSPDVVTYTLLRTREWMEEHIIHLYPGRYRFTAVDKHLKRVGADARGLRAGRSAFFSPRNATSVRFQPLVSGGSELQIRLLRPFRGHPLFEEERPEAERPNEPAPEAPAVGPKSPKNESRFFTNTRKIRI